ncbi:hypothetical protein MTO96_014749 [Rhipicephalus appendiculatus]
MIARKNFFLATIAIFALQLTVNFAGAYFYPELKPYVQKYQDVQRCGPMPEDYYLVYRNYLYDSNYGGTSRCVKFHKIERYIDVHGLTKGFLGHKRIWTPIHARPRHSDANAGKHEPATWNHHTVFMDCISCYIGRHHYARNGYGCTLWRPASLVSQNRTDYCDFIFDVVCGSSPKYYIYDSACDRVQEPVVTNKAPWSE